MTKKTATEKAREARKANTLKRHKLIYERFNFLYQENRRRLDDVWQILCDEFGYAETTIKRIVTKFEPQNSVTP